MAQFKRFYNTWPINWIQINFTTNDAYVYLTSTAPSNTVGKLQDITLIDLTYFKGDAGGDPIFKVSPSRTGGVMTAKVGNGSPFVEGPVIVKASGGSVGPFRYVVIGFRYGMATYYENLTSLICYYDYGYSITLSDGEELTLTFNSNTLYSVQ